LRLEQRGGHNYKLLKKPKIKDKKSFLRSIFSEERRQALFRTLGKCPKKAIEDLYLN